MAAISHCHEPGLLIVLARPKAPAFLEEFHEWYNTEHGPLRMRLDFIQNGYRYRTSGDSETTWAGVYDIDRVSALAEPIYTNLRQFRSEREQDVMNNKIDIVQRKICKLIAGTGKSEGRAPIMMTVSTLVKKENVKEMGNWCSTVHVKAVSHLPGWRRTRCYEVMDGDLPATGHVEILRIDEFDRVNISGDSGQSRIQTQSVHTQGQATIFHFYHEFRAQDYRPPVPTMEYTRTHAGPSGKAIAIPLPVASMHTAELSTLHASRFVPPMVH